ncbi:MAG: L-rhamnose isomerase, partial [Clostridia bacterium]|nr:L-rhamnose isomerase [Clostridia bacterium]
QEEMKTAPLGDVWNEYLERENVTKNYLEEVKKYEEEVLVKRK